MKLIYLECTYSFLMNLNEAKYKELFKDNFIVKKTKDSINYLIKKL